MPIIGSAITTLDALNNYSDASLITTQKNLFNNKTSLVVIKEGGFSSFLYFVRVSFCPKQTQEENKAAVKELKEMVSSQYGETVANSFVKNFSQVNNHAFSDRMHPLKVKIVANNPILVSWRKIKASQAASLALYKAFSPDEKRLHERLIEVSREKNVTQALELLAGIAALPDEKEEAKRKLRTDLLKNFGIFGKPFKCAENFGDELAQLQKIRKHGNLKTNNLEILKIQLKATQKLAVSILKEDDGNTQKSRVLSSTITASVRDAQSRGEPIRHFKESKAKESLTPPARKMVQTIDDWSKEILAKLESPTALTSPVIENITEV